MLLSAGLSFIGLGGRRGKYTLSAQVEAGGSTHWRNESVIASHAPLNSEVRFVEASVTRNTLLRFANHIFVARIALN